MYEDYGGEYYDDNPSKYVDQYFRKARRWFDAYRPALQEQWDMWMGHDAYIEERRRTGKSALSFPLIFASSESIFATVYEIMQANDSLLQWAPKIEGDIFGKIAGEKLQSGYQNIRADLDWDSKFLDMIALTTILDWAHVHLEPEYVASDMGNGVLGAEKLYPSFNVYPPGRIIWDGSYEKDSDAPGYFKMRFESYQWCQRRWPKTCGPWMKRQEKTSADSDFFRPGSAHPSYSSSGLAISYDGRDRGSMNSDGERKGFLIVEAHLDACFRDGHTEQRVFTYMPDVVPDETVKRSAEDRGTYLEEGPRAFQSVKSMQRTIRSRRVPLSNRGMGTAGKLVPFQRHFSSQVSMELDMDQLSLAPPLMYRAGAFVGSEGISLDPYTSNSVNFQGMPPGTRLSEMVQQLQFNQSGRGWASDTKATLRNIMDLVSGAFESATGEAGDTSEKATIFQGRSQGGMRRITTQFVEHAASIIWIMQQTKLMMAEAPTQFLYPPIMATSQTLGRPGILSAQDVQASVMARIPALSEYANKQQEKIVWRMVGDGLAQIPLFAQSLELQAWYIERMIRSLRVPEVEVQEAMNAAKQGIMEAKAMQMMSALPPEVGGGVTPPAGQKAKPPGGSNVGPPGVARSLTPMSA